MKRRKSPQEKKAHEYEEARPLLENPHAFRKNWPKKKRRASKTARRVQDQALRGALAAETREDIAVPKLKELLPAKAIKKNSVWTLAQRLESRARRKAGKPASAPRGRR